MKTAGIILIIAGIAMLIFRGFSVQTEKTVVDAGPIEINKKENKWVGWPVYAGAIAVVAGVALVLGSRKKAGA
ncbi:MAG: hypothetical protein ABWZ25_03395 [Chitinophagaceae bacterium]